STESGRGISAGSHHVCQRAKFVTHAAPNSRTAPAGHATMSPAMAEMTGYQRYLFRQIEPYLGRRLREIGVGYGTLTGWLLETGARVLATDIDEQCLEQVRRRWPDV